MKVVVVALTHHLLKVLVRRSLPVRRLLQLVYKAHLTLFQLCDPLLVFFLLGGLRKLPDGVGTASLVLSVLDVLFEPCLGVVVCNHVSQFLLFLQLELLHATLSFLSSIHLKSFLYPFFLLSIGTH